MTDEHMPTTPIYDFGPTIEHVAAVAAAVADDQLDGPTPCGTQVRHVLSHILGLSVAFRDAARKESGPTTSTPPDPRSPLPGDWRTEMPARLADLRDAWREPAAWTGFTRVGGVDLPGAIAGQVGLNELLIHGWDLAAATSQSLAVDPSAAEASYRLLQQRENPSEADSIYGPAVEVPASAPLLDRALGLSGRDPSWTPGRPADPTPAAHIWNA